MEDISTVIDLSANCEQSIMTNCTYSVLSNFGWWNDRNDQKQEYWHGNFSDGQIGCKCATEEDGCTASFHAVKVSHCSIIELTPGLAINKTNIIARCFFYFIGKLRLKNYHNLVHNLAHPRKIRLKKYLLNKIKNMFNSTQHLVF